MTKRKISGHRYQNPEESKQWLQFWAEMLRTEEKEEATMQEGKVTVVKDGQSVQERMSDLERYFRQGDSVVDSQTGETLPITQEDEEIVLYRDENQPPRYLKALYNLEMEEEDKLALLSVFESQVNVQPFTKFVNMEVEIFGCIVWSHPPFRAKNTPEDSPLHPGYEKILFISMDKNGELFVIEASYGALANHIEAILSQRGWYLWEKPVTYRFSRKDGTGAFQMYNQERAKNLLLLRKGK